ncbi:hypothetical protein K5X82_02655 [Halosquirtibacter xylanolyticus]|uniref:hypothetical protein n=1 Tax=Halosquirtibacter xylanolyticus TaxID=3374599 RepID=UPI0037489D45|nr:hypothetical protein K5X82_02655 [Prolixibacteraceae bacterium]
MEKSMLDKEYLTCYEVLRRKNKSVNFRVMIDALLLVIGVIYFGVVEQIHWVWFLVPFFGLVLVVIYQDLKIKWLLWAVENVHSVTRLFYFLEKTEPHLINYETILSYRERHAALNSVIKSRMSSNKMNVDLKSLSFSVFVDVKKQWIADIFSGIMALSALLHVLMNWTW